MNILLVEDDPRVARLVERALMDQGNRVDVARDGVDGLARGQTDAFDLVILDVLLPEMDGLAVCRRLREQHVRTPVLMLTARDAVPDRVRGLDAGADDYLTKPFALEELMARVRALGRRSSHGPEEEVLVVGPLRLDVTSHEVYRNDQLMELTLKEFTLLEYFMRHPGQVLTKSQIADHVWGYDSDATSNVVETYVHYLRNKIDRGHPRPLIRTLRGIGYMLKE